MPCKPSDPDDGLPSSRSVCLLQFYIILNVAVGGGFFGDHLHNSPYPRPYDLSSGRGMRQFWEKKDLWHKTWDGEKAALQVDYVRVYKD